MKRTTALRTLFALCLVLFAATLGFAQQGYAPPGNAGASEDLTSGDTASGFTTGSLTISPPGYYYGYTQAQAALIVVENNSIRCTEDGSTPTQGGTGHGYLVMAGQSRYIIGSGNVQNFKMISATNGQPAKVETVYYFGGY